LRGSRLSKQKTFSNMIVGALVSLLAWIVSGIAFILPEGRFLPVNFGDLLSDVIQYAYGWDWIIPVTTVFSVFSAIIVFYTAEMAWRFGKYFIGLVRGN